MTSSRVFTQALSELSQSTVEEYISTEEAVEDYINQMSNYELLELLERAK